MNSKTPSGLFVPPGYGQPTKAALHPEFRQRLQNTLESIQAVHMSVTKAEKDIQRLYDFIQHHSDKIAIIER